MTKLAHDCTHFTYYKSKVQNSPSVASTVCEPSTSRRSSWIYKRQRNQRLNCQHTLNHRKSKRVPEKHLLMLYWLRHSLWRCGSKQSGKFLTRWEYQTTLPASWEICMQVKKKQYRRWNNGLVANWENSAVCTRTGKGQFSYQSQRKAMSKNAQTTAQFHSSHTLEK